MNFKSIYLLGLLAAVLASLSIVSCDQKLEGDVLSLSRETPVEGLAELPSTTSVRRRDFKVPSFLDFSKFKQMFQKRYTSLVEEMRRAKIYLSKSVKAIASAIKYKWQNAPWYSRVNHMSDRTDAELQQTLVPPFEGDVDQFNDNLKKFSDASKPSRTRRRRDLYGYDLYDQKITEEDMAPENFELVEFERFMYFGANARTDTTRVMKWHQLVAKNHLKWQEIYQLHEGEYERKTPEEIVFVDHRKSNCFTEPASQWNCGACYAHAFLGWAEFQYCRENGGKKIDFSWSYIVECGKERDEFNLHGCNGGDPISLGSFVRTFGFIRDSTRLSASCPAHSRELQPEMFGELRNEDTLSDGVLVPKEYFEQFIEFSPMVVGLVIPPQFYDYGGGVQSGEGCQKPNTYLNNHAVLLVGHGREDGQEYWLIRNSFSKDWGEEGYWKLAKSVDCFQKKLPYGLMYATKDGRNVKLDLKENPSFTH